MATTIALTLDRQGAPTYQKTTVGANTFYHWWDYDTRGAIYKAYVSTTNSKPGAGDVTYLYNSPGLVSSVQYGSGTAVPYAYNSRDWLLSIGSTASTTYPFSAAYTYLDNGTISHTDYYNK